MKDPLPNPLCQMAWRFSIEAESFDYPETKMLNLHRGVYY